jgi:adenylate cyclase
LWQTLSVSFRPARLSAELFQDLRAGLERTATRYDRSVAWVIIAGAVLSLVALIVGRLLGHHFPSATIPVVLGLIAWYAIVIAVIELGLYRPWLRYLSTGLDSLIPTLLVAGDVLEMGPRFAIGAAGLALYPAAVAASTLRLDWRLCLWSGALSAAQYLAVSVLLIKPALSLEEASALGMTGSQIANRTLIILMIGVFCTAASRAMRTLTLRAAAGVVERDRVRGLFGVYVSQAVVDHLLSGPPHPGGERREATFLFSDIRSFTHFSETRPPEQVLEVLNLYFERMCAIVERHGGVVNKFLGDGMLVMFGAPNPLQDDADQALACGFAMHQEAERMREMGEFPDLRVGIGLHRGVAVVGNVGGSQRQEYTAIGDVVNTASRVQDLTKRYGRPLLLTREVHDALRSPQCERIGAAAVKGRDALVELYAPTQIAPGPAEVVTGAA